MIVPQPFQYQGRKRALVPMNPGFLPAKFHRLVDPFAGSSAMTIACAGRNLSSRYWISDLNKPLADLLNHIINHPEEAAAHYARLSKGEAHDALEHFYTVRETFTRTQDPKLFLDLFAGCIKGAVRYISEGFVNQNPDKRRLGTRPETMWQNIIATSILISGSANRAKSWFYEYSNNWKTLKEREECMSCYWAYPEKHTHVAMKQLRRVDLLWLGEETEQYAKLKADAVEACIEALEFVKEVLRRAL